MKEHFSSRVTKLLVILALAIVASVMFVFVGCGEQHVHTWTQTKEQAATCTADGFIEYTCEGCGDVRQETVQATGHVWKDDGALQTHPATCTEDGYYYKLCTVCNYEETSSRIPATGHTMAFADVTVTLPTCTADGSVTGKCADCGADITWTADEIAAGAKLTGIPDKNVTVGNKTTEYYPTDAEGKISGGFLQMLGHDYEFENTSSCVALFSDADKTIFGENAAQEASKYYYDYCNRCETAFEVKDHTVPAGYTPCEYAMNANNTYKVLENADNTLPADVEQADQYVTAKGEKYAYQCSACKHYIDAVPHEYELMSLVSGTPDDPNDPPVWEAAPEDATFSCEYYQVCKWCGVDRISAPHKPNAAEATCTDAVTCTVCQKVLTAALGHDNTVGGAFGDVTKTGYVDATCTSAKIYYKHCSRCAALEAEGKEVEWVLGENYITEASEEKDEQAKGHMYNTTALTYVNGKVELVGSNNATKVYDTTSSAVGCARPFWFQDVCTRKGCTDETTGHIRIAEKPAVYTKDKDGNLVTVTEKLDESKPKNYYWFSSNDSLTKEDVKAYNLNMYLVENDAGGNTAYAYTDAEGLYGYQEGGAHDWKFQTTTQKGNEEKPVLIDYEKDKSLTEFVQPTCTQPGTVLYYCEDCGEYAWMSISLKDYLNGYETMNGEDVKGMSDVSAAYPTYEVAITQQKYHESTMFTCGHAECASCDPTGTHTVQWTMNFSVAFDKDYTGSVKLPEMPAFHGWSCYTEDQDMERFASYLASLSTDKKYTDFDFAFYTAPTHAEDSAITIEEMKDEYGVPDDNGNAYRETVTIYVVVTPKDADLTAADDFGTFDAEDKSLNVDFTLNNKLIGISTITRMDVEVIKDEQVLASAYATSATLANLTNVGIQSWGWDTNNDKKFDSKDNQTVTIKVDDFCVSSDITGSTDGIWAFTKSDVTSATDLSGASIVITITCGDVEFTLQQVIA